MLCTQGRPEMQPRSLCKVLHQSKHQGRRPWSCWRHSHKSEGSREQRQASRKEN